MLKLPSSATILDKLLNYDIVDYIISDLLNFIKEDLVFGDEWLGKWL